MNENLPIDGGSEGVVGPRRRWYLRRTKGGIGDILRRISRRAASSTEVHKAKAPTTPLPTAIADKVASLYSRTLQRAFNELRAMLAEESTKGEAAKMVDPAFLENLDAFKKWVDGLFDQTQKSLFTAYAATAKAGAGEFGFDFSLDSPIAEQWVAENAAKLVTVVTDNTKAGIRQTVKTAFEKQVDVPHTARAIREQLSADLFGYGGLTERQVVAVENYRAGLLEAGELSPKRIMEMVGRMGDKYRRQRAEMIARTEILRASNAGQQSAWGLAAQVGLINQDEVRQEWLLAEDELVCDQCEEIASMEENQDVGLNEMFTTPDGDEIDAPPLHPNCFLSGTAVRGNFIAGLKAWYSGKVVKIKTANGEVLTVTSNHPILTLEGFVPANQIKKGIQLLRYRSDVVPLFNSRVAVGDIDNAPVVVEKVFESLKFSTGGSVATENPSVTDLHGDARFVKGKIDIVGPHISLLNDSPSYSPKSRRDRVLVMSSVEESFVSGLGPGQFGFESVNPPSTGGPRSRTLPLDQPSVAFDSRPFQSLRVGLVSSADPFFFKVSREGFARDSDLARELVHRDTRLVQLDPVVEVRQVDFVGHVYDLQSTTGWLIANNLVTSNCRCAVALDTGPVGKSAAASAVPMAVRVREAIEWVWKGTRVPVRPLYVRRPLLNAQQVKDWYEAQGVKCVPASEMHVTLAYSTVPFQWQESSAEQDELTVPGIAVGKGGAGSGNYGHEGRPGEVGGSGPGEGGAQDVTGGKFTPPGGVDKKTALTKFVKRTGSRRWKEEQDLLKKHGLSQLPPEMKKELYAKWDSIIVAGKAAIEEAYKGKDKIEGVQSGWMNLEKGQKDELSNKVSALISDWTPSEQAEFAADKSEAVEKWKSEHPEYILKPGQLTTKEPKPSSVGDKAKQVEELKEVAEETGGGADVPQTAEERDRQVLGAEYDKVKGMIDDHMKSLSPAELYALREITATPGKPVNQVSGGDYVRDRLEKLRVEARRAASGSSAKADRYGKLWRTWISDSTHSRESAILKLLAEKYGGKTISHSDQLLSTPDKRGAMVGQAMHGLVELKSLVDMGPSDVERMMSANRMVSEARLRATLGKETITLYRGMKGSVAKMAPAVGQSKDLYLNPVTSFSTSKGAAAGFAGMGGVVLKAEVPISDIMIEHGSSYPFVHHKAEREYIVLTRTPARKVTRV